MSLTCKNILGSGEHPAVSGEKKPQQPQSACVHLLPFPASERARDRARLFLFYAAAICVSPCVCGRRREAKVRGWKEKVNDIRKRAREREKN